MCADAPGCPVLPPPFPPARAPPPNPSPPTHPKHFPHNPRLTLSFSSLLPARPLDNATLFLRRTLSSSRYLSLRQVVQLEWIVHVLQWGRHTPHRMPSCEAQALVGAVVHSLNVKVPSPDAGGAQTSSQLFASRARFLLPLHVEHVAPSSAHVEHRRSDVADAREVARHGTHSRPRTPVPDFQSPQHPVVPRRCPGHEAAQKSLPSAPVWRYFESLHSSAWPVTARWRSTTRTTADAVVFRAIARCMVNAVPGWRGRGERGSESKRKSVGHIECQLEGKVCLERGSESKV